MKMEVVSNLASTRKLSDLRPGEEGIVRNVHADTPIAQRLLDLGLLPETPIRALRRAPLGDPTVFEFRGYRLCLRQAEADQIEIDETPKSADQEPARHA